MAPFLALTPPQHAQTYTLSQLTAADVEGSTTETLRKLDQASALELLDALAAAGLAGAVDVAARRAIVVITVAKYARQIKPELNPLVRAHAWSAPKIRRRR